MKSLKEYISQISEHNMECNGFCILKPEFLDHLDEWKEHIESNGWDIKGVKQFKMSNDTAKELYKCHKDKDFYNDLCNYMSSDECVCYACQKDCKDPIEDMNKLKEQIRKKWGKDDMKNAMHSSDSLENVKRETKIIFN